MLDACLPETFGRFVIGQLETNRGFELLKLAGTNFDVKVISFVGNFENFWPGKAIDAQAVAEDENSRRTHANQNVNAIRVL